MSLRRIALQDFVIVQSLDLDLSGGFGVLTGETGAGKSILIDALQLVLGARADAGVVREGASRCEITAEFDMADALRPLLDAHGFTEEDSLLIRRTIDADGRSRAWVNGSAATMAQLRDLAEQLVDIHGQHAWQSLTRADTVRSLLDAYGDIDAGPAAKAHAQWRHHHLALAQAREQQATLQQDSERLAWQINELEQLAPADDEWDGLNQQHARLANAQSLVEAAMASVEALDGDDGGASARLSDAIARLKEHAAIEPGFASAVEALESALAQVEDTVHSLRHFDRDGDLDPSDLQALDERLSLWMSLARRFRRQPEELPALLTQWKTELTQVDQALDLEQLQAAEAKARKAFDTELKALTTQRKKAAPRLSKAVTEAMQDLGMAGGSFEVALLPLAEPQASGSEAVEFRVAGHAGVTARPVAKVASGGELSRIALAISVVTSQLGQAPTLIFDEVDSGIGGEVAHTVGRLLRQLGADRQVLAVTHLAQVAACANQHLLVSKRSVSGQTLSTVQPIDHEARVTELARMLGGSASSQASMAHARELLET
ncbi:DNA repair protein RecN [Hydrogenophaga sp. 5NK40-0174]|uniref:DNA repair protein RecN n=1 Tax=Hydrogenophaga sp. 5NK40-0174 TaxID=3127649 RepID=UPI00310C1664